MTTITGIDQKATPGVDRIRGNGIHPATAIEVTKEEADLISRVNMAGPGEVVSVPEGFMGRVNEMRQTVEMWAGSTPPASEILQKRNLVIPLDVEDESIAALAAVLGVLRPLSREDRSAVIGFVLNKYPNG